MQHIIYINPDFDFDGTFAELERESSRDPKAFLENARKNDAFQVFDRLTDFAFEFNDEKISDEGYLIVVDDHDTPRDLALKSILEHVTHRGIPVKDEPGTLMLAVAPLDFYSMTDDPFGVIHDKLGYDGIELPVTDRDGYYTGAHLLAIEAKDGTLTFVARNESSTYYLTEPEVGTESADLIRSLLDNELGAYKRRAWLTLYNLVLQYGAAEGIRIAAGMLGRKPAAGTTCTENGTVTEENARKNILEAMRDPHRNAMETVDRYLLPADGIRREYRGPVEQDLYLYDPEVFGEKREFCVRMTIHDGYAEGPGVRMEFPKLEDLTPEQIEEIDAYTGRIHDSGCIVPVDVCLKYGKVVSFGIMDTSDNHDPDLVRELNIRWMQDHEMFKPVICALYQRDHEQMYALSEDVIGKLPQESAGSPCDNWTDYVHGYLQKVADNQDLEAIIKFVRNDKD